MPKPKSLKARIYDRPQKQTATRAQQIFKCSSCGEFYRITVSRVSGSKTICVTCAEAVEEIYAEDTTNTGSVDCGDQPSTGESATEDDPAGQ